jgi:hypothetical protein
MNAESLVLFGQLIQIFLQQNIFRVDICEDQVNLGCIASGTSSNYSADNLQHGSNSSATSNHTEMSGHVGCVDHSSLGTLDLNCLSDNERGHMLRDITGGVGLDEEIEMSGLVVARDGGVGSDDFFLGAVWLGERGCNGDVLPDWEAENRGRRWEFEAVAGSVSMLSWEGLRDPIYIAVF